MSKFIVKITKQCEFEVEAKSSEAAEQIARDQEADGCVGLDLLIEVRPIILGEHPIAHWIRVLDNECNVSVYEAGDLLGLFGFTGCEADHFASLEEAVEAAVVHYGLVKAA